jgi:hypothetical protein
VPNPFNPSTVIPFGLARDEAVTLRIYDVTGRCVATLADGALPAGPHAERWTGQLDGGGEAASGVYFYRLAAGTAIETRKMALIR